MVRRGDKLGAVLYGRKFLSPFSKLYMDEFKRVIVSTVVINEPEWSEFEELFGQKRWSDLQQCFFENLFQLHNMSSVSLLEASLQVRFQRLYTKNYKKSLSRKQKLSLTVWNITSKSS